MSKIEILLVDDEEPVLEVSKIYLEKMNNAFHVITIDSAIKAMDFIQKNNLDVIISDYQMPQMNGLEFLSTLRNAGNEIPFIIFTGKGREEVAIQALNLGADYYLQKGGETITQFHELINLIEKLYEKKQTDLARKHLLEQQISINKLALTLGETRDLNKIYKTIFQHIYAIMDADTFVVSFYDKAKQIISPGYALIDGTVLDITILPPMPITHKENEIHNKVIESGSPIYYPDLHNSVQKIADAPSKGSDYTKSAVFVPMKIGGDTIGVMEVQSYQLDAYSQQDIDLLSALANVAAVAIQNARLFNTQQHMTIEILEEKNKTQRYFDIVNVIILVLDLNGNIITINKRGCDIIGFNENDIVGRNWIENFIPNYMKKVVKDQLNLITKEEIDPRNSFEYAILTKTNQERIILWKISLLKDNANKVNGILKSGIDITEHRKTEDDLAESQQRYQKILEHIDEGVILIENKKTVFVSQKASEIIGYSVKELRSKSIFDICLPEEKERLQLIAQKAKENNELLKELSFWIQSKDGKKKLIRNRYSYKLDAEGKVTARYIFMTDITEQTETLDSLLLAEKNYHSTIDSLGDPLHVIDQNFNILLLNKAMTQWLTDLNVDGDIIGKTIFQAFPFLPKRVKDEYDNVFNTSQILVTRERTAFKGMEVDTETRKIPIIEDGKVIRIITIIRDISNQIRIEHELQEIADKYEILFEYSHDAIILFTPAGKIINANQKALDILGYNLIEIFNQNFINLVPDDFIEIVKKELSEIEKTTRNEIEINLKKKSGEIYLGSLILLVIEMKQEKIIQAIIRDKSYKDTMEIEKTKRINDLLYLSNTAVDLVGQSVNEDIYRYMAEQIQKLAGDSVVLISSYDELNNHFHLKTLLGVSQSVRTISKIIGKDPFKLAITIDEKYLSKEYVGKLIEFKDSLPILTKGVISPKENELIVNFLKTDKMYGIGLVQKNKLFGAILILIKKGYSIQNKNLIEAFASQASVALLRKQAEEDLLSSEKRFRTLIETMNDGLGIDDEENKFTYVNVKLCDLLGYNEKEMIGKKVISYLDQQNEQIYLKNSSKQSKEEIKSYEITWTRKDGTKVPTIISPQPIFDSEGEYLGSFAVITDISRRKENEDKLRMQQIELQKQRDELESFAATIAHDLRGKMQVLSLYNFLSKSEYTDKISASIDEMASFVNDLLILAKKGEILGEIKKVNLNKMINEIVEKIKTLEPNLQIAIDKLPNIFGDSLKLKQVFENLLMNIVKHANATKAEIKYLDLKNYHEITVKDNGKGISEEKMKEITKSWATSQYSSFGLLITFKIVKAHKGELVIESGKETGTTIRIQLPKKFRKG